MTKRVYLRLTGKAERFIEDMNKDGLTERDVIAKALWLFEIAWKTQRVVLLNEEGQLEYIFTQQPLAGVTKFSKWPSTKEETDIRALFNKYGATEKKSYRAEAAPEGEGQ